MSLCCGRPDSSRLPNDPSNDVGFYAVGISGGIRVVMRMPGTNPQAVAYTILYSSAVNHFDASVEIAKVRGEEYYDWHEEPTLRYYWIVQVSINGTHEERLGPVSATSIDPSILAIERISKRIHEGLLATSLRTEIDRIDPLATRISQEALQRASELGSLTEIIQTIQESVGDNLASFESRLTVLATDQESIVENVDTLLAEFVGEDGLVTAAIQEAKTVIASETLALAERSSKLEAVFEDDDGNVEWAALQHQLSTTKVDKINNTIENAWMVKLQSQLPGKEPLIGGFGLVNDGLNVEAGFDVDTFWVGRANGAQIYPFIIDGSDIYFNGNVQFSNITGEGKPQEGATRNVYRGNWANAASYVEGDIVNYNGNSWAARGDHNASTSNRPPELHSTTSTTWLLNSARGDSSHFRYSAYANGSSMTTTPQSNSEYVGFATGPVAPTSYTAYVWSKYVGPQGDKGDKGNPGSSGPRGESVVIIYRNVTAMPAKPSNGPIPSGWATSLNPSWTGNTWRCQGIAPVGSSNYVWGDVDLDFASWRRPNKTTIDGSYIETGTITAQKINTVGLIVNNLKANMVSNPVGLQIDTVNGVIKVYDEQGRLRVRIGDLTK